MKIALVHDWLNGMRGGEKVLEQLLLLFPGAPVFTLHHDLERISESIRRHPIHASFIQHLPFKKKMYRHYLPLFPLAVKSINLRGFDLILSVSHCAAKNIPVPPGSRHLCYCLSPMRYLWELQKDYFGASPIKRALLAPVFSGLKRWDLLGAARVERFVAISRTIQDRILRCYGRESDLVYPPVDLSFTPESRKKDYCLVLSALVPYKRVDLAIEACRRVNLPLVIAGSGPEAERLKRMAGPHVTFRGWVSEEEKLELLRHARALLFPGHEDFGIVPLEAMAFATPVVALASGGLSETVTGERSGLFFSEPTVDSLADALRRLSTFKPDLETMGRTVEQFSVPRFQREMKSLISEFLGAPLPGR